MFLSLITSVFKVFTLPYLPASWQRASTEKRVIRAVRDAYRNVPFYRQKYDNAGININSIQYLEDLKLLPLLELRRSMFVFIGLNGLNSSRN